MSFRTIDFLFAVVLVLTNMMGYSQQKVAFGTLTTAEKNLSTYEQDTLAHAVVLYERGDNYFEVINRRIYLVKEYHTKIKVLDELGLDYATISIPLYKNGSSVEKIKKLQAITHVDGTQYRVLPSEIFTKDVSDYKSIESFTFPKATQGSILEYNYKMISPFVFNFNGWAFQSEIPKIYSEFNAKIPGNYRYNRTLTGNLKLDLNEAKIQKQCFHIAGYPKDADCEVLKYAMRGIPAFKAAKQFMLSEKNYISRLDFELSEHHRLDGVTDKYTKSWKDVDEEFRTDQDIGRQLTKNVFFEKNVRGSLLVHQDPLIRAKNIYSFIRNHYTWDGQYGVYGKARVKEAFEERKGSASEINMSLINLLNAGDIKTNLMLISTRESGLPKRNHPVMSDFNYAIAKVEIDGKTYLLDATDKFMPFGMLPFRALNHYGRVMDFKEDSYWFNIQPENENSYFVRANVKFDVEKGKALGVLDVVTQGYEAIETHKNLKSLSPQAYIEQMEQSIGDDYTIISHEFYEERSDERRASERFSFEVDNILQGNRVYINPFFVLFFKENPFKLEKRNYPVDLGYGRMYKYQLSMVIPEGYNVAELPEKQVVHMGDKIVTLEFYNQQMPGQISILFKLALNKSHILADDYEPLKKVFEHVTDIQRNSLVVLEKDGERSRK
ncbi:DUF3857 domain-containing protein [Pareuzebyella sediminis]|uniref:DUF3857 domain-containing protein n=1 Tax=Pareuzebyella sediminis TaxID=2607998 RepID=UPI0011ECFA16|nr:DUF3857 domain-containing protein [Pareuzebyella sediminis]